MKLVNSADQALANITRLQSELEQSPRLVDRLSLVHAWYIDTRAPQHPRFGFSKFAGYQDLDAETYLRDYKELDGRNTEWVLKNYFDEVRPDTQDFRRYHEQLTDWLGSLGRTPRKKVRLMVLKPELWEAETAEDRHLLHLLVAVAEMLPANQRHELRARL